MTTKDFIAILLISMAEKLSGYDAYNKRKAGLLREIGERGGMKINEILKLGMENPDFNVIDPIGVVTSFLDLGYLEYQEDTGKFIRVVSGEGTPETL